MRKTVTYGIKFIYRTGGLSAFGFLYMGLLFLLPLLAGCPIYQESYYVYYDGNNNTDGFPPVDSRAYFPGEAAVVLAKPEGLKKGNLEFLGWQSSGNGGPFQAGDIIDIGHGDIWLYASWQDDPDYKPFDYADHPGTGGVIITRYYQFNGYSSLTVIPDTLDDKPVTVIGEGVFAGIFFDNITLPAQLAIIGNKAFAGGWLGKITIPDTVTTIGKLAFQFAALESLSLGRGLETIDDYAFDGNRLTVLFLPENIKTVGEGAFSGSEVVSIEIGGNVTIRNETSMGIYGASFLKYYQDNGSQAGVYVYNSGEWRGPYRR
jgi:hypothetical protein